MHRQHVLVPQEKTVVQALVNIEILGLFASITILLSDEWRENNNTHECFLLLASVQFVSVDFC